MTIAANIQKIKSELPVGVKLIAVSKTKPVEMIQEAYNAGQRVFGENKVQEMVSKQPLLPLDIEWHLIGHLQSNKVKYIAPFVALIHSVDSLKLLETINKESVKNNRIIPCLLQIYIAKEETKFGLDESELNEIIIAIEANCFPNIMLKGFMGMATNTENHEQISREFRQLKTVFNHYKTKLTKADDFTELSMGMSNDYKLAIQEGATMVRIGSNVFGER